MKKSFKEFFPRLIFGLFFVYVFLLGVINLLIVINKDYIESSLARILEAQKVQIGNISNLPLIFISGTEFSVIVNDELSLTIEGVYLRYNIFKLFTKEFGKVVNNIEIESISFYGHTSEIKNYTEQLKQKYPQKNPTQPAELQIAISQIQSRITIKRIAFVFNSMTEFWHTLSFSNSRIALQQGVFSWNTRLKAHSIWSNFVFLGESEIQSSGTLSNFSSLEGSTSTVIQKLNLGGIPFVENNNVVVSADFSQGTPNFKINDPSDQLLFTNTNNQLFFSIKSTMNINYKDFEEYNLLDHTFAPGKWNFDLKLSKTEDWKLSTSFKSPEYPNFGLDLAISPIMKNELYSVFVSLKTHYFGSVQGDLFLPIRKGLYPLPSGSLHLENTRFILNGLVFSGTAFADVVPGKNEIDLTAFNVRMNNGLIGNTSAKFEFTPEGVFNIYPRKLPDSAVDVTASIGREISVELKANDIDGDFVAQNIKIPIFGLKDSRYKGDINLYKKHRKDSLILDGKLKGFLDEEEQIDAAISLEDNIIKISRFHILNPNILLTGDVIIDSFRSNTLVTIDAQGSYNNNEQIPIDLQVDVQKYQTLVSGFADTSVPIKTITLGTDTDFTLQFQEYPMKKFGILGDLTAFLVMRFDTQGITRFSIQEGSWNAGERTLLLDFDAAQSTNSILETSYFRIGLDQDILDGYGYFSFLYDTFKASFRFDRGGFLQFNIGRYIMKSRLNLVNFTIDNIFNFDLLDSLALLRTEETEKSLLQSDISISGPWNNLVFQGGISLEGLEFDTFQLAVPDFYVSSKKITLTNLRLRHSRINLDSDAILNFNNQQIQSTWEGSFAFDRIIKTDFQFEYQNSENTGILDYHLPNLYIISKKPMNIKGQIFHDNQEYLFLSDHAKYGITGAFTSSDTNQIWNISLLSDSLKLLSEGILDNRQQLQTDLKLHLLLDKLTLSGDIRRTQGEVLVSAKAEGIIDNPIINGTINLNDITVSSRSLRNRLSLPKTQSVFISNNLLTIPDLTIDTGGGTFGLDGVLSYQDQTIENVDLTFYSKTPRNLETISFLNWNLDVPLLTVRGKTYISNINLSGNTEELILAANIQTENIILGLELDDTLRPENTANNPFLGLLEVLNLDVNINFANKTRFLNPLFDMEFEQINPVVISGNLGDGSVVLEGDFNVARGRISYLNSNLKIVSGTLNFSEDPGDPYPIVIVNTETSKSSLNELLDIYVTFEGKLPNIELTSIASSPSKTRTELLTLLSGGTIANNNTTPTGSAQDLIAGSVGIAENALFINPLTRRIQRLIPVDTFQIKTDMLGNITRATTGGSGAISGLSILHGSELEVGWYIPGLKGLQTTYQLRLESPDNTSLNSGSLNQIHKAGLSWSRILPYQWQIGFGVNILGDVDTTQPQATQSEALGEVSVRKRF
ncbi:MAG: translocation/assembly module TamB domain-containing protein [Brevinema sp.]